jgi:hypothetical protein
MKTRNILEHLRPQQPWELMRADWPKKCMNKKPGWPRMQPGGSIMSTADLFRSFARETMQAAKEADEPRERVMLLMRALQWAGAAQRSETLQAAKKTDEPGVMLLRMALQWAAQRSRDDAATSPAMQSSASS